jgi:hypothetical protein
VSTLRNSVGGDRGTASFLPQPPALAKANIRLPLTSLMADGTLIQSYENEQSLVPGTRNPCLHAGRRQGRPWAQRDRGGQAGEIRSFRGRGHRLRQGRSRLIPALSQRHSRAQDAGRAIPSHRSDAESRRPDGGASACRCPAAATAAPGARILCCPSAFDSPFTLDDDSAFDATAARDAATGLRDGTRLHGHGAGLCAGVHAGSSPGLSRPRLLLESWILGAERSVDWRVMGLWGNWGGHRLALGLVGLPGLGLGLEGGLSRLRLRLQRRLRRFPWRLRRRPLRGTPVGRA